MFVGCGCIAGFPVCQEGWTLQNKQLPGSCCPDYECVENGKYPIVSISTTLFIFQSSFSFKKNIPYVNPLLKYVVLAVCTPGQQYTVPENPCRNCLCGDNGQPTDDCTEIACSPPYCGPGKTFRAINGVCCKFECIDLTPGLFPI